MTLLQLLNQRTRGNPGMHLIGYVMIKGITPNRKFPTWAIVEVLRAML